MNIIAYNFLINQRVALFDVHVHSVHEIKKGICQIWFSQSGCDQLFIEIKEELEVITKTIINAINEEKDPSNSEKTVTINFGWEI